MNEIKWPFGEGTIKTLSIKDGTVVIPMTNRLGIFSLIINENVSINIVRNEYTEAGSQVFVKVIAAGEYNISFGNTIKATDISNNNSDLLLSFIYDGNKYVLKSIYDNSLNATNELKAHITTIIDTPTVDTWTDFDDFSLVLEETSGNYITLNSDLKTFEISKSGLYKFGGCIHIQNNTVGKITATVLSRIFINNKDEARCSQRGFVKDINADGEDVLSYSGTAYLYAGDTFTLQYFTDNPSTDFYSNSNFENSVAATLWIQYSGQKI